MTKDERIEADGERWMELVALRSLETALRKLVKDVEWGANHGDGRACPWCGRHKPDFVELAADNHAPDCAAFTKDGRVRP